MDNVQRDFIEKSAVSIVTNYLYLHNINNHFNVEDKIPNIDGFFTLENKDYNAQIKGTSQCWQDHDIKRTYFEYALSNFLMYIIVEHIDNGIYSEKSKIYYYIFQFADAIRGLENDCVMKAGKFDFLELNDISIFKEYVEEGYRKYGGVCFKGVSISDISMDLLGKSNCKGKVILDDNQIDIKKVIMDEIQIPNVANIKIDQDSYVDIRVLNVIEQKNYIVPNTSIEIVVKKNTLTNCTQLSYENLNIVYNITTKAIKLEITEFHFNPFNDELYNKYKQIFLNIFNSEYLLKSKELQDIISFIDDIHDFKIYLEDHGLLIPQYNDQEILVLFYHVFKEEIPYYPDKSGILMYKFGINYVAITNFKDTKNYICPNMNQVKIKYEQNGKVLEFSGYTILFSQLLPVSFRRCLNFNYEKMLEADRINLENKYLDEHVSMIIFNYLLIYWEYNHSKQMLQLLLDISEQRISDTENKYFVINYLQLKKILDICYSCDEIKFLSDNTVSEDKFLALACNILLIRILESEESYQLLSEEEKGSFNSWPIKYLCEKFITF